jgi:predicted DNA-binding protein with PD1-like motif
MPQATISSVPRPRTLIHPGKSIATRILHRDCKQGRHLRLLLKPGLSLYDALISPLQAVGIHSASTTILGGHFSHLDYCVAPPDATGQAVTSYTEPIHAGVSHFIFGNATIGKDANSKPIVHCHAAFRTASGACKGGHIITQTSFVGHKPISVLVTAFTDFDLQVFYDPETNISLLQPHEMKPYE